MIFATVGTHEDPFDRLLEELERLMRVRVLTERVVCQSGYCTTKTELVECHPQLPFEQLQDLMAQARIIITHGGPASIMQALSHGVVPIVVPRQSKFGEHVDDHQCRFAEKMSDRVITVFDIADLEGSIVDYEARLSALPSAGSNEDRASVFARKFDDLCWRVLRS